MTWVSIQSGLVDEVVSTFSTTADYLTISDSDVATGSEVSGIIYRAVQSLDPTGYEPRNEIHVKKADVASPRQGDRLRIGSDLWEVDGVPEPDVTGLLWILVVRRVGRP